MIINSNLTDTCIYKWKKTKTKRDHQLKAKVINNPKDLGVY